MTEDILKTVSASILIADFVNVDTGGKANLIGAGITLLGFEPQMGTTTPFSVFVRLSSLVPLRDQPAVEIVLVDAAGEPVRIPGPTGESQAMRIAQNVDFLPPAVPGVTIPQGAVASSAQFSLNFPNGLPLAPGLSYSWRVQVDHDVIASESFYIPQAIAGPVIG